MASKDPNTAKNANQTVSNWFETQQQLWDKFLILTAGDSEPPWAEIYQQSLSAPKQFLDKTLDAQSQWAHQCIELVAGTNGQSEPASQWTQNMDKLVDEWTDAERQLCEACLTATPWQPPFVDSNKTFSAVSSAWQAWIDTGRTAIKIHSALTSQMHKQQSKSAGKSSDAV